MKRRSFLQGLVASAGATAVPLPTLAKAAAQTTTKAIPFHYGWACVYAQMNNGIAAADIERVFKISSSDASGLMDRMLKRGVIHPAGLDGRSHPTRPWQPMDKRAPVAKTDDKIDNHTDGGEVTTGARAREKFQKMIAGFKAEPHYVKAV